MTDSYTLATRKSQNGLRMDNKLWERDAAEGFKLTGSDYKAVDYALDKSDAYHNARTAYIAASRGEVSQDEYREKMEAYRNFKVRFALGLVR